MGLVPAKYIGLKEKILVALYNYTADDNDELSFEEGDRIVILNEPDSEGRKLLLQCLHFISLLKLITLFFLGWTEGRLLKTGETGLFPIEYVGS